MRIRWVGAVLVASVAAVLLPLVMSRQERAALSGQATPASALTATSAANAMAVDAIPGEPIDLSRVVSGGAPFEVDIVITNATTPYEGYRYRLTWDPAVLAFDSETVLHPPGLTACLKSRLGLISVRGQCAGGRGTARFVGPVNTVAFHCVSDGESPLHLVTAGEDPSYTSTFDTRGAVIDTTLTDAVITCRDVGPPVPTPVPPPNDDFANATLAPRLPFSDSVNTASATQEPAEPEVCARMGSATVWYRFTPDTTQFVQADTLASDFDTVLAVYTGATVSSLTRVACNDDMDGLQSEVVAELEGDRTYYFQVGSYSRQRGSLVFNLEATAPPPAPMPNAVAVDAVSGSGIDPSRTVTGVEPFLVDINVTAASQPYQGYQYVLQWDPAILAYDSQVNLTPAELTLCGAATVRGNIVAAGCVRTSGPTQFVGPVNTVSLHCVADGTGSLHLRSLAEGYLTVTKTAGPAGTEIDNLFTDAYITCQGTGRKAAPSPVPTPLPVPPVTGTGGFLEEP